MFVHGGLNTEHVLYGIERLNRETKVFPQLCTDFRREVLEKALEDR